MHLLGALWCPPPNWLHLAGLRGPRHQVWNDPSTDHHQSIEMALHLYLVRRQALSFVVIRILSSKNAPWVSVVTT